MVNEVKSIEEAAMSSGTESENDRSSSQNTTIPAATLSSVKSEDSTENLITKSEQGTRMDDGKLKEVLNKPKQGVDKLRQSPDNCSKSMLTSVHSDISSRETSEGKRSQSKLILYLGVGQVLVGVCMVCAGGLVMVRGAALGKAGAGLWSGCLAILTGVMGLLGGINDCYGLYERQTSRLGNLFLTLFLALSLVSLAAGNLAAVLAGTGLLRDIKRNQEEETENYWPPILSNIGLLVSAIIHCFLALFSVYHTAKRVCSCFRPREPFNHNQFDPSYSNFQTPYSVVSVTEKLHKKDGKYRAEALREKDNRKELSKALEGKLTTSGSDTDTTDGAHQGNVKSSQDGHRTSDPGQRRISNEAMMEVHGVGSYFGSSNSKDRLVCSWLGGQPAYPVRMHKMPKNGIRKKMKAPPVLLVPATAGNTLNRGVPVPMVPVSAGRIGYATLPMVQAGPPGGHHPPLIYPPHGTVYQPYPVNDMVRIKRKRYSGSSSSPGEGGKRRNNQLTRSLERIYRREQGQQGQHHPHQRQHRRKNKPITEADVIRTYTGLDRAIAEQFIVACDESRHSQSESPNHTTADKSDYSAFDSTSTGRRSGKY